MVYALVVFGLLICALQAVRAARLLSSALWLMASSALLALALYLLGALQVAVIELSVGAGLVTVLFVFAISLAGDDVGEIRSLVPKPLATILIVGLIVLASAQIFPTNAFAVSASEPDFASVMWDGRALDVVVQVVLIFVGALGVLSLLAEGKAEDARWKMEMRGETNEQERATELSVVRFPSSVEGKDELVNV